jgi:6-phosphogluconolactonase
MDCNKKSRSIYLVLLALWSAVQAHSQHTCIFIGSYNWDKTTEGIYVYELDTVNGTLAKITTFTGIANPSYLTISPNGQFIYACTESKTPKAGSVSSFEFNYLNKRLTFLNSQPSGGENPVYVSIHKNSKWLVDGNYTEGSVSVYPLAPDGKIKTIVQNIQFQEGSINVQRQDRSHIHAAVFSPSFDYVFLPDLGADKIRCYQFDTLKKEPLQSVSVPTINVVPGSGPRHVAFHPNGKFAYCIEELSGTIDCYSYTNGELHPYQHIDTHSGDLIAGFESADIHISPDGRFLYASNRGKENNIAIFSIAVNGTLKVIGYQSTEGTQPRIFAIDPSGKFLVVANVTSNNLVVFKRDAETGVLSKTGVKVQIKSPSCVQFKVYE